MSLIPDIETVMTPCPYTVSLDQSVNHARQLMRRHNIRHLPVCSEGKLVGIVTDRDISFAVGVTMKQEYELVVRDIYSPEPYAVTPMIKLDVVCEKMASEHYGCAVVVEGDTILGIVTTVDLCKSFAEYLRNAK